MGLVGKGIRAVFDANRIVWFLIGYFGTAAFICVSSPLFLLHNAMRKLGCPEWALVGSLEYTMGCKFAIWLGGVDLTVEKRDPNTPTEGVIYGYNHASNLDPTIVGAIVETAPKYIYKKELGYVPFLGWGLWLAGHIAIDRKKKEKAIEAINKATKKIIQKKQCVAIAPEGTRSKNGELLEFKKGPFHMALSSGAPIVPVVLSGVYELCPPGAAFFRTGCVRITILPAIYPKKEEPIDDLIDRTREVYVKEIAEHKKRDPLVPSWSQYMPSVAATLLTLYVFGH